MPKLLRWYSLCAACAATLLLTAPRAAAQTGVSDDRVSLPEGPGSLEGIGENVSLQGNMGALTTQLPIPLPPGFSGATPSLGLSYSSAGGSGPLGIGWSMPMPAVERMTYRGLPTYDRDDDFAANGEQLVRVASGAQATYRARFEGGFTRYTWVDVGSGGEGYWIGEQPNGSRLFYGADASGRLVPEARVSGPRGTFRYHLVEQVDIFGHAVRYTYLKDGVVSLMSQIRWVFQGDEATYRVDLTWEPRRDATGAEELSNAKPGFDERLTQRLQQVEVFSRGVRIHRVQLAYQPYAQAGGFTRLAGVQSFGANDTLYPVAQAFTWSDALGGACAQDTCAQPFTRSMGSVGGSFGAGDATLLDINGDALPDLLLTRPGEPHRFYLNVPSPDGSTRFQAEPVLSAVGTGAIQLGTRFVHAMDLNGDGFTDLLNAQSGHFLRNTGQGDWDGLFPIGEESDLSESDFQLDGDSTLARMRFIDLDNDKRIDLLRATGGVTTAFRNTPEGFVTLAGADNLGVNFDTELLDLTDMNGDGLLDLVQILVGSLRYRLNLGWGHWGDWREVRDLPLITDANRRQIQLEDLNGDALADLLWVAGSTVQIALNRNGEVFYPPQTFNSDNVDTDQAPIPLRADGVTVLAADMNGNGSNDIVWVEANGAITTLELFPTRPNLITRIDNGLGHRTEISYTTSVRELARDAASGEPWEHPLPFPMTVVAETRDTDLFTQVVDADRYRYHNGFFDGVEKQFRGYSTVETIMEGDASQEEGLAVDRYEIGAEDVYRHGLKLYTRLDSAGRTLSETHTTFADCPVAELPATGLDLPIRFICSTAQETVVQEGTDAREWVTLRKEMTYDGYGNVTREVHRGTVAVGGGACAPCDGRDPEVFGAPCGPQCLGDESFTERDFIAPGAQTTAGRWILNAAWRERTFGREGSALTQERRIYYDGAPFVGLPEGRLERGLASRVTHNIEPGSSRTLAVQRSRFDEHGMVVESWDPLATPEGTDHRRLYTYDADNLRITRVDIPLVDPEGAPYSLRQELQYEPRFDRVVESTGWMRVVDGVSVTPRRSSFYQYDEFGRQSALILPGGDTPQSPTETYTYELATPVSRVIIRRRSQVGGPLDIEEIRCLDGRGRPVQTRARVGAQRYVVAGFKTYNRRSLGLSEAQPWTSDTAACEAQPPAGTRVITYRYDAADRPLEARSPDSDLYDTPSLRRTVYLPLRSEVWDAEDNDPQSPHAGTPTRITTNGLGLTLAVERSLEAGAPGALTAFPWDSLGRPLGFLDPEGNTRAQTWDLLGRILTVDDLNTDGLLTSTWDDAGNMIATTDERGVTTRTRFDGLNRPVERWDEADPEGTRIRWFHDVAPGCGDDEGCTFTAGELAAASWPLPEALGGEGRQEFGYDARTRPVLDAHTLFNQRFVLRHTHDNANRTTATTFPDGRRVESQHDPGGRVVAVPGYIDAMDYDEQGFLAGVTFANGTQAAWTYDSLQRLDSSLLTDPRDTPLQGFAWTRDREGHILQMDDLVAARLPQGGRFTYDAWYRLLSWQRGQGDDAELITTRYDDLDNVMEVTSDQGEASRAHRGAFTYASQRPNAVTRVAGMDLRYDAGGYTTQRGEQRLRWDFLGRLVEVQRGDDTLATHAYGSDSTRVARMEGDAISLFVAPDFELHDGIAALYVRLGNGRAVRDESDTLAPALLGDPSGDGAVRANDAWLEPDAPNRQQRLRAAARRLLIQGDDATTWLHTNHRGDITLATNAEGQPIGERAWESTGQLARSWGFTDPYGFTGQQQDPATGLLHFEARFMDPWTGRWLSADPAFRSTLRDRLYTAGESSPGYAYVANDPINRVDSTGLQGETIELRWGYQGEHTGDAFNWKTMNGFKDQTVKVIYLGMKERQAFRATVKDGRLVNAHGIPIDTTHSIFAQKGEEGHAIFVLSADGQLFVSKVQGGGLFHHSSLVAGEPVLAAGTIHVVNGDIKLITNHSGHYKPGLEQHRNIIEHLTSAGAALANTQELIVGDTSASPLGTALQSAATASTSDAPHHYAFLSDVIDTSTLRSRNVRAPLQRTTNSRNLRTAVKQPRHIYMNTPNLYMKAPSSKTR